MFVSGDVRSISSDDTCASVVDRFDGVCTMKGLVVAFIVCGFV